MKDRRDTTGKEAAAGRGSLSRRSFMGRLWLLLGCAALAEYVLIALDFARPHPPEGRSGNTGIFVAGPTDRFENGTVTAFPAGKFYLARLVDGGFLALSRSCTHLGCTVPWNPDEKRFVCPCHASAFSMTGDVSSPPAPRALDYYAVRIENGVVKVDLSKPLRRRSFDNGQAAYS
jgi:cytochrome b6-f complex iron-sulfur subunit